MKKDGNNTNYDIDDFYSFISTKLSEKNISYETEENKDLKIISFITESNDSNYFCDFSGPFGPRIITSVEN